jgi:hypothetical protein
MKLSYSLASIDCLKAKRQGSKIFATGNIAQRYMELLRLRSQVLELEAKQASFGYGGPGQSIRRKSGLTRSHQPGIN